MAETADDIFRHLESRFRPGRAEKEMTFYFSLDELRWTVTIGPESCSVEPGRAVENADCFVKTTEELFVKMYNGHHYPGMSDFLTGRIKSNNPYLMKTFIDAFD
ncbi:MAG TPA: hypothetical protein PLF26_04455 [Blastocatellia bacterium]|nr:hypothetical protein [Blastocatellia bacterium]